MGPSLLPLAVALALFVSSSAPADSATRLVYPVLSPEEIGQLKTLHRELVDACKPPDCLLIFPGRSFSIVAPYLEAKGVTNQVMLPISGLSEKVSDMIASYASGSTENRTARSWRQNFFDKVLSRYLPLEKYREVKSIKVVDFTGRGQSLILSSIWLQEYLPQSTNVEVLAYTDAKRRSVEDLRNTYQTILKDREIGFRYLSNKEDQFFFGTWSRPGLVFHMNESAYEMFSPFSKWTPYLAKPGSLNDEVPPVDFERRKEFRDEDAAFDAEKGSLAASYRDLVNWFSEPSFEKKAKSAHCKRSLAPFGELPPVDGFFVKAIDSR